MYLPNKMASSQIKYKVTGEENRSFSDERESEVWRRSSVLTVKKRTLTGNK